MYLGFLCTFYGGGGGRKKGSIRSDVVLQIVQGDKLVFSKMFCGMNPCMNPFYIALV